VTLGAAEPSVKALALTQTIGIGDIGFVEHAIDLRRRAADAAWHRCDVIEDRRDRRIEAEVALLALTAG
jgi:hypothetical protein